MEFVPKAVGCLQVDALVALYTTRGGCSVYLIVNGALLNSSIGPKPYKKRGGRGKKILSE